MTWKSKNVEQYNVTCIAQMYAKMKDFKCLIASRLSLKFPKIQNLNYQLDILDNQCLVKLCTDHKFCELIMFLFGPV